MSWKKQLPKVLGVAVVVGVGLAVTLLIRNLMNAEPQQSKKTVQQITLLKPPPPPPPPPKVEQPPEPEMEQEKVDIPEPEALEDLPDMADELPAGDLLGLDAEGGAGSDGFGLIGRKGGRGLLAGAGDAHVLYASRLQREIEEALLEFERVSKKAYSVIAKIWLSNSGAVTRVELAESSGDGEIDNELVSAITALPSLSEAPPADMPQPIKLRITSRI